MDALDRDLARRIVERSMAVIGHNVNVMDADGVILGSGEPDRIGSVHEGALLAVSQGREVLIDTESADGLHGVRPGVNLPLRRRDEVIGAIGITGDPAEVGVLGGLIRVTAELMVEQAQALERSLWERREREDLLTRVLAAELDADEVTRMEAWAAELDLDLSHRWVVVLVAGHGPEVSEQVLVPPSGLRADPSVATALPSPHGLLVLVDADARTRDPGTLVAEALGGVESARRVVVAGMPGRGIRGIAHSHATALDLAWLRGAAASTGSVQRYVDHSTPTLLAGFREDWRVEELAAPWQRLVAGDRHGELARTFRSYCTRVDDAAGCAEELHVHRNTLRYRLDRIETLTGLSLARVPDLVRLYWGATLMEGGGQMHNDQGVDAREA